MADLKQQERPTLALEFPFAEHDDDLDAHLAAIKNHEAIGAGDKPDPVAMGDNDVKNVMYINFNPKDLGPDAEAAIKAMNKKLELNTDWLSVKAGVETAKQMKAGKLPGDMAIASQMKRGTYRAKVIDYLMLQSLWMGGLQTQAVEKTFSVKKADFHAELLTTVLQGLALNPTVFGALEVVLQQISDSIFSVKDTTEKSMFWLLATVYHWDSVTKETKPTVRTIYFEATSDIKKFVAGKATVQEVNLKIGFIQSDAIFNVELWDIGIEKSIKDYLVAEGVKIVNKPIDIPVDP